MWNLREGGGDILRKGGGKNLKWRVEEWGGGGGGKRYDNCDFEPDINHISGVCAELTALYFCVRREFNVALTLQEFRIVYGSNGDPGWPSF